MNYRTFADADLELSEICFGPMRFSAKEPADDDTSRAGQRALRRALERGVNFVHSSYEYGTRWAVGQVLKDTPRRHDVHHIIKVPIPDFDDNGNFDPAKFRLRVEEALRDLHAERIAILQHLQRARPNTDAIRIPNIPAVNGPMIEIFEKLKQEGKVGYLVTFPYTPGFAAQALKTGVFSGTAAYYNPIEMEMAEFFPELEARGQSVLCIRPFMAGLLTDPRVDRGRLPQDDRFQGQRWDAAYERLEMLKTALGSKVKSWTQFAIKFALSQRVVTSLIVGLNTPEQVDGVLDAADGDYPDQQVFDQVLDIFEANGPVSN